MRDFYKRFFFFLLILLAVRLITAFYFIHQREEKINNYVVQIKEQLAKAPKGSSENQQDYNRLLILHKLALQFENESLKENTTGFHIYYNYYNQSLNKLDAVINMTNTYLLMKLYNIDNNYIDANSKIALGTEKAIITTTLSTIPIPTLTPTLISTPSPAPAHENANATAQLKKWEANMNTEQKDFERQITIEISLLEDTVNSYKPDNGFLSQSLSGLITFIFAALLALVTPTVTSYGKILLRLISGKK